MLANQSGLARDVCFRGNGIEHLSEFVEVGQRRSLKVE